MNADVSRWHDTEWEKDLMSSPPALANILRPDGDYAIIGPGGGVDVLRAVANGSPNVTGIEINPIIANTVMRDRYADYSNHLYERPEVHIQVTDGRSFVRNAKQNFDIVQMTLVDTWASTAAGAFALSENSLYTVDAFREYFEHLKPDGIIAITRWEFRQPREALRVVSVAMEALHELGVPNARRQLHCRVAGGSRRRRHPGRGFGQEKCVHCWRRMRVREHLQQYPTLKALYLPTAPGSNPFSALIASNDPYAFARQYAYNVAPVNDNAPFFFFTLKFDQILHHEGLIKGIDWKVNLGVAVLLMVFLISLFAVLGFLIVPLAFSGSRSQSPLQLLYFVVVGLGYILVEIAFIQRFVLFLGHPTYALTVVVFLLLLSSGAGSMASRRWLAEIRGTWIPLALIVLVLALYVFILPQVLDALVGLSFAVKLLISFALLAPLGFAMGMPFPCGLRALAQPGNQVAHCPVEWAWAMNAGSSVLGSVLAMVIAIQYGLNVTLACGALAYLFAILLFRNLYQEASTLARTP